MTYDAFISYSHSADGLLAPAVQNGLQRLARPWHRLRALNIFRDETGLSVNPHLWGSIAAALDRSRYFVLLASPEAAASPWVERELRHWLAAHPAETVLPVLTGGELVWDANRGGYDPVLSTALPSALQGAFAEEPRHLDLRWAHGEDELDLRHTRFRHAIADLAAPIHGVAREVIEGQDVRHHRRAVRLAWGAAGLLAALTIGATGASALALNYAALAQHSAVVARVAEARAVKEAKAADLATAEARSQARRAGIAEVQAQDEAANQRRAEQAARDQAGRAARAEDSAKADSTRAQIAEVQARIRADRERRARQAADAAARREHAAKAAEAQALRQAMEAAAKAEREAAAEALAHHQAVLSAAAAKQAAAVATSRELAAISEKVMRNDPDLGLLLASESWATAQTIDARAALLQALTDQPQLDAVLSGLSGDAPVVVVSPDGRFVAGENSQGQVLVWDAHTGVPLSHQPPPVTNVGSGPGDQGHALAFSPDGETLLMLGGDAQKYTGSSVLWDTSTGSVSTSPAVTEFGASSVAFAADGRHVGYFKTYPTLQEADIVSGKVVTIDDSNGMGLVDASQAPAQPLASGMGCGGGSFGGAISPDGRWLAKPDLGVDPSTGYTVLGVQLWDTVAGVSHAVPVAASGSGLPGAPLWLRFNSDGTKLTSAWAGLTISTLTIDVSSGSVLSTTPGAPNVDGQMEVDLSQDGSFAAWLNCATGDVTIRRVDGTQVSPSPMAADLLQDSGPATAFSPDGSHLFTGGGDGKLRMWSASRTLPLVASTRTISAVAAQYPILTSPAGKYTGYVEGGRAVVVDNASGLIAGSFAGAAPGHTAGAVTQLLEFSADQDHLAFATSANQLLVADLRSGAVTYGTALDGLSALSPDGSEVAVLNSSSMLVLTRVGTGSLLGSVPVDPYAEISAVQFSPDGKIVAVAGGVLPSLHLYDADNGAPLALQPVGSGSEHRFVRGIWFSPDTSLVTVLTQGFSTPNPTSSRLQAWSIATGSRVGGDLVVPGDARTMTFSGDGKELAFGEMDGTLRLFDVATQQPLAGSLLVAGCDIQAVSLDHEGGTLQGFDSCGDVLTYDLDADREAGLALRIANRLLSAEETLLYLGPTP